MIFGETIIFICMIVKYDICVSELKGLKAVANLPETREIRRLSPRRQQFQLKNSKLFENASYPPMYKYMTELRKYSNFAWKNGLLLSLI